MPNYLLNYLENMSRRSTGLLLLAITIDSDVKCERELGLWVDTEQTIQCKSKRGLNKGHADPYPMETKKTRSQ